MNTQELRHTPTSPITLTPELVQEAINNSDGLIAWGLAPRTMEVERAEAITAEARRKGYLSRNQYCWNWTTPVGRVWAIVETMRDDVIFHVTEFETDPRMKKLAYMPSLLLMTEASQRANEFLEKMLTETTQNIDYYHALRGYFTDPSLSTVHLRDKLLKPLGFDFNDPVDFNAFALLDSAHAHGRQRRGM